MHDEVFFMVFTIASQHIIGAVLFRKSKTFAAFFTGLLCLIREHPFSNYANRGEGGGLAISGVAAKKQVKGLIFSFCLA